MMEYMCLFEMCSLEISPALSSPAKPWGVYPLGVYSSAFLPKEMPGGKLRCAALRVELVRQGLLQAMGAQGHEGLGGGVSSRLTCVEKLNQKMGQAMGKPMVS